MKTKSAYTGVYQIGDAITFTHIDNYGFKSLIETLTGIIIDIPGNIDVLKVLVPRETDNIVLTLMRYVKTNHSLNKRRAATPPSTTSSNAPQSS